MKLSCSHTGCDATFERDGVRNRAFLRVEARRDSWGFRSDGQTLETLDLCPAHNPEPLKAS